MGRVLTELQTDNRYQIVPFASLLVCAVLFRVVSPAISKKITGKYEKFDTVTKYRWDIRIVSTIHSVLVTAMSVYVLLTDDVLSTHPWAENPTARVACGIILGYLFLDLITMITHQALPVKEVIEFTFHHFAVLVPYYFIMSYGVFCYHAMLRLFAEFSTPSMNLRWCFIELGYKKSSVQHMVSGILLYVSFFIARILPMPVFALNVWNLSSTPPFLKIGVTMNFLYLMVVVLDSLNLYWFYRMSIGVYKTLKAMKGNAADTTKLEYERKSG